jgi:hypothetical protein
VQDQVDGFVVGVGEAVAEEAAGAVEAGDGVAQPVADGDEFGQRAVLVFVLIVVVVFVVGESCRGSCLVRCGKQVFEGAPIDCREWLDGVDGDALVEFVDGGVHRAEFDDLRADVGDEAAVGGAAGGGQFGRDGQGVADRRFRPPRPGRRAG